jgi:SAM-dependent methyltransferase
MNKDIPIYGLAETLHQTLRYLELNDRALRDKELNKINKGEMVRYPFISSSPSMVYRTLITLFKNIDYKKTRDIKFVDAGCGNGWVVYLARETFDLFTFRCIIRDYRCTNEFTGIDISDVNIQMANNIFKAYHCSFIKDDLFNVDFSKYNVIYYYCPISTSSFQIKLEKKIEKEMPINGYLIPNYKQDRGLYESKKFTCISEGNYNEYPIYKKIKK